MKPVAEAHRDGRVWVAHEHQLKVFITQGSSKLAWKLENSGSDELSSTVIIAQAMKQNSEW